MHNDLYPRNIFILLDPTKAEAPGEFSGIRLGLSANTGGRGSRTAERRGSVRGIYDETPVALHPLKSSAEILEQGQRLFDYAVHYTDMDVFQVLPICHQGDESEYQASVRMHELEHSLS